MNHPQTEPWLTLPASVARAYIDALQNLLEQAGFPVHQWLADACLESKQAKHQERLPLYHALSLWQQAEREAQTPLLGLQLGQALQPRDFPILGQAALSADTLRDAIRRLQEFEPLIWDIGLCHLETDGQNTNLVLNPRHISLVPRGIIELAVSGWLQVGRILLPGHQDVTVRFSHHPLTDENLYRQCLSTDVTFGQPINGLTFPTSWLDTPLPGRDGHLQALLQHQGQKLLANYHRDLNLPNEVRARICQGLLEGPVDPSDTARDLGFSTRSLRRKLAARNTSWRLLYEEVRRDLAML
ncbi:AraC family transcriptional regulator ligand-binding domain-containing protein [Marinobacter sp. HL-58]|uniref:AraC family transcriptional regulator ligand-binding domain-containing protein n=1 Tax=Marinobacter sp. HL-58 TaxID=1479237 RepID=UPI000484634D|nr:AraC family transcriptional regulator ligand-binding domain-containing protein [Marinobacter sp. HL-58]